MSDACLHPTAYRPAANSLRSFPHTPVTAGMSYLAASSSRRAALLTLSRAVCRDGCISANASSQAAVSVSSNGMVLKSWSAAMIAGALRPLLGVSRPCRSSASAEQIGLSTPDHAARMASLAKRHGQPSQRRNCRRAMLLPERQSFLPCAASLNMS